MRDILYLQRDYEEIVIVGQELFKYWMFSWKYVKKSDSINVDINDILWLAILTKNRIDLIGSNSILSIVQLFIRSKIQPILFFYV